MATGHCSRAVDLRGLPSMPRAELITALPTRQGSIATKSYDSGCQRCQDGDGRHGCQRGFGPRCRRRVLRPAGFHRSFRQRLFVEHDLGGSSRSAIDAAPSWVKMARKAWAATGKENGSSGSHQCPRGIPHSFVISSNPAMTNTRAVPERSRHRAPARRNRVSGAGSVPGCTSLRATRPRAHRRPARTR